MSLPAQNGFTLIEVLVAIAVITTISFAPFAIIAQHLVENSLAEDRVKAHLMAQEVIEHVHFARDQSIIDVGARSWFDLIHDTNVSNNPYAPCVIDAEDVTTRPLSTYCTVQCKDAGVSRDCNGSNGFVSGVSGSGGTRGNNAKTCDGGSARANNAFTVTLNIIIPDSDDEVQYATVESCVSWQGKDEVVRKVEARETMFEWVLKE